MVSELRVALLKSLVEKCTVGVIFVYYDFTFNDTVFGEILLQRRSRFAAPVVEAGSEEARLSGFFMMGDSELLVALIENLRRLIVVGGLYVTEAVFGEILLQRRSHPLPRHLGVDRVLLRVVYVLSFFIGYITI